MAAAAYVCLGKFSALMIGALLFRNLYVNLKGLRQFLALAAYTELSYAEV